MYSHCVVTPLPQILWFHSSFFFPFFVTVFHSLLLKLFILLFCVKDRWCNREDVSLYGPFLVHVEATLGAFRGVICWDPSIILKRVGPFLTTAERLDSDPTDGHDDMMDCVHEPWHDIWCFISSTVISAGRDPDIQKN